MNEFQAKVCQGSILFLGKASRFSCLTTRLISSELFKNVNAIFVTKIAILFSCQDCYFSFSRRAANSFAWSAQFDSTSIHLVKTLIGAAIGLHDIAGFDFVRIVVVMKRLTLIGLQHV